MAYRWKNVLNDADVTEHAQFLNRRQLMARKTRRKQTVTKTLPATTTFMNLARARMIQRDTLAN